MSKSKKTTKKRTAPKVRTKKQSPLGRLLPLLLILSIGAIAAIFLLETGTLGETEPDLGNFTTGYTLACQQLPPFLEDIGFSNSVAIDSTNRDTYVGLIIQNVDGRIHQHESWTQTGYIVSQTRDKDGYIYVIPQPDVSLEKNLPGEQNRVYRVDRETGVMSVFLELPAAGTADETNPFGAMGIAYDCDTHSLYVSSIAGSSWRQEVGRIFRIDLESGKIVDQLEGLDTFGVGVFNGDSGKRLYFGHARSPIVQSIQLDADGDFYGEPRTEFSLAEVKGGNPHNARSIRFTPSNQMTIKELNFNYRPSVDNNPWQQIYTFAYQEDDTWEIVRTEQDRN